MESLNALDQWRMKQYEQADQERAYAVTIDAFNTAAAARTEATQREEAQRAEIAELEMRANALAAELQN